MDRKKLGASRPLVGVAGAALIASVFLPWSEHGGTSASVWELWTGVGALALLTGGTALFAAATDGGIGFFRPDVSASGAADLLGVATTLAVAALTLFDVFEGASPGSGAYVALASAALTACLCADWRPLRGAPLFPR